MIRLDFNAAPIFQRLSVAHDRLADLTTVYTDIGEYMIEATKQRFLDGTAPDGTKWLAKSPATIARYLSSKDGDRPDPLIGPSKRLSSEINKFVSRDGVEVGSALEYSSVMQHGATKGAFGTGPRGEPLPWGDIPARVWLGISDSDERNILDIVDEHLGSVLDE